MVDVPVVEAGAWPPDETWIEVGYYGPGGECFIRCRIEYEEEALALLRRHGSEKATRIEWTVVSSARRVEQI